MPYSKWLHHKIDLSGIEVEVWADDPSTENADRNVTMYLDREVSHFDMTPNEARALASLLVVAAEQQERKS